MDSVQANESRSDEADYNGDIRRPDCRLSSRLTSEMLEVEESSKDERETCFGTVRILR